MTDPASLLQRLRPLRPPESDGSFDILVMAIIGAVGAVVLTSTLLYLRARRRPLRHKALSMLAASRSLPAADRLAAQASLLRHVAGAVDHGAASLRGETWLARLDAIFVTDIFSDGPGRAFGDALYKPRDDDPAAALDHELERLLTGLEQ